MGREYDSSATDILRFFVFRRLGSQLVKKMVVWILITKTNYFSKSVYVTLSKRIPEFKELGESLEQFMLAYGESINNILERAGTSFVIYFANQNTQWKLTAAPRGKKRQVEKVLAELVDIDQERTNYYPLRGKARQKAIEWGVPID